MEAVSDFLQPIFALQSGIQPWHWLIVAVALGALEMLFTGGVLMGGAIAAILVGAAAFAAQIFPDALPPGLGFGLGTQAVTFAVLMFVFATAMRIGRRRAAAMVDRAAATPAPTPSATAAVPPAPTAPAAPPPQPAISPAPKPLMPAMPVPAPSAPPSAAPARPPAPTPEKMSPQPPSQPMVAPAPPPPPNPTARVLSAPPKQSPQPRPTQMGPMRVAGPTATTTPAPAVKPPQPPAPSAAAAPKPGSNPQELVGREYTLWKPLVGGKGTLRVAGIDWALTGPDVPAGARVRVVAVQGSTLTVTLAS